MGNVFSTNSGAWNSNSTWDPGVPSPTDDVFIRAGDTVTIYGNGVTNINSLSVSGILQHADNSTTEAHKLNLSITNDCTIAAGGKINAKGRGYDANQGPGRPTDAVTYTGASHGGRGGSYYSYGIAGPAYGSVTSPTNCGSGDTGVSGGGAVILAVGGATTVDGTIDVTGAGAGSGNYAGAGGSIYITSGTFGGSGEISAAAGTFSHASTGGSGGGRIAVVLTGGSSFGSVTMTAAPHKKGSYWYPSAGTIFTKTTSQSYGTLKVDGDGVAQYNGDYKNPTTEIPVGQTVQVDSIIVTNQGNLWVSTNSTLIVSDFSPSHTTGYLTVEGTLDLPDDFAVSNITFMPHFGCTLDVTNLTIASGARVSHLANKLTELHKTEINIPGNLTVEAGAHIDVSGMGYRYDYGPWGDVYDVTQMYGMGGSHGGQGGKDRSGESQYLARDTYGSAIAPTNIGMGGYDYSAGGNDGGGAVKIVAGGAVTVDGTISADGEGVANNLDGGAAGGSVWLTASSLSGSGTIRALGGDGTYDGNSSGGGGGRIAVILTGSETFGSVSMSAVGGDGGYQDGAAGTIYLEKSSQSASGGELIVDNNGRVNSRIFDLSYSPDRVHDSTTDLDGIGSASYTLSKITVTNGGDLRIGSDDSITLSAGGTIVGDPAADDDGVRIAGGSLITTDTTFSYENCFIAIDEAGSVFSPGTALTIGSGAQLIVNAPHTITGNVTLASGGAITHNLQYQDEQFKVDLAIDGDLTIPAGCAVDVDGVGHYDEYGPGGGGAYGFGGTHGGQGGYRSSGTADPDDCYGSITSPTNIGSGGYQYTVGEETDGGGAAKITVTGTTDLDGMMTADGNGGNTLRLNAGGSGGSIWLTTSSLTGSGTIKANGGTAKHGEASGGGGGRVAVWLTGSDSFGSVVTEAHGGDAGGIGGYRDGAAGTVYKQTQTQGAGKGTLIVDNTGQAATTYAEERTEISSSVSGTTVGSVIIRNNGYFDLDDNQAIVVQGSWSNASSFAAGTDAAVKLAGTDTVTVFGNTVFEDFICTNVSKQVNFEVAQTTEVNGDLVFGGPTDTSLVLRSTSPGTQWDIDVDGGTVVSVEYVDVQDSDATNSPVTATFSIDSGNNTNWLFAVAGQTNIWLGGNSATWGDVLNWSLGAPPTANDAGVVISNGLNDPTLPSAKTFQNLEVWNGAVLSLGGFDLTVDGETVVIGTLTGTGSETLTVSNLAVSGTLTLTGAETVYAGGNVDFTGGTLNEGNSHVILDGIVAQTITSDGESFSTLTASNQSALVTFADAVTATTYYSRNGNVTYGGNFNATIFDVYSDNGAVTHTFNAGSTYTFQEMWLRGSSGKTQHLESAGTWNLDVSAVANVANVNVEYSDAGSGVEIQAISSTDSGNNTNWNFGPFSVWTGDTDSDFHTAGNWDPPGVPDATTYVIVDDTTTLRVTNPATVKYAKIGGANASKMEIDSAFTVVDNVDVIFNGTLEINNDPGMTVSGNVSVASGGTLTHADNSTTEADMIVLTVGGNLVIAQGGGIDVMGIGYENGYGPGTPPDSYLGGSHGGIGGTYSSYTGLGPTYGSYASPTNLGSGGSANYANADGGGAVRLVVGGACTVDGTINANGKIVAAGDTSGGSGGSVWITCHSFAGFGTVSANGGYGPRGDLGGGGGGRIAVILTNGTTFGSVALQALPASIGNWKPGGGTVYTKTSTQTYGTLKVDNNNLSSLSNEGAGKGTPIPDGETWEVEELVLLNNANLRVTNNTTLNFRGAKSFAGSESNAYLIVEDGGTLGIAGELTVSNVTLMAHWDATLAGLTNLTIGPYGILSHLPNVGASEAYRLRIDIPGDLDVRAGGKIDVTARGYDRTYGPGAGTNYNGGAHGGQGGRYQEQAGDGDTYGSVLAPTNCGSGPGGNGYHTSDGGGVVRLIVGGTTTVDGQVLADGGNAPGGTAFCGGAGGSIWLTTATLAGSGEIRAGGGESIDRSDTGSGGGGRVAVVLTGGNDFGSVDISARGGTIGNSGASSPGTVYLERAGDPKNGGRVIVDCVGEDHRHKTYLPPEIVAVDNEMENAMLVVTGANSEVTLSSNLWVRDILVYTDAYLELGSNTLYVYSREHHIDDTSQPGPGGPTNTVVDHYDQVVWLGVLRPPGSFLLLR